MPFKKKREVPTYQRFFEWPQRFPSLLLPERLFPLISQVVLLVAGGPDMPTEFQRQIIFPQFLHGHIVGGGPLRRVKPKVTSGDHLSEFFATHVQAPNPLG